MSVRQGYCIVSVSPVRSEGKDSSEMVTQLLFGELVSIETNSPNNNWVTISEESFPSERTGETLTIQYPCRTDIR